ncbi:MAG: DNA repair protein RadC [Patescibacteria group bacterium]|nr:DNA repair protein RadC [Patescibacteria group bacterium]
MRKTNRQVLPCFVNTYLLRPNDLIFQDDSKIQNKNHQKSKKYILKIKDLEEDEKPREKLKKIGPQALSVAELLAVFLNVGTKKEDILSMSSRILKEYGEKNMISQTNPSTLQKELDIPFTKACQIIACFELGRRFFQSNNGGLATIRTAQDVFNYLKDMRSLPKEQLRGLYLNSHYQLIHDEVISVGSLTTNIIHPREVFKPAVEYSAAAVIVAHNHPSGNVKPTKSDIKTTKQLVKAGKIFGINLLDHIIIAGNNFKSIPVNYFC